MKSEKSLILWLALACAACGQATTDVKAPQGGPLSDEFIDVDGKPAPKWVTAPASYRKTDGGEKVLCDQGSMSNTTNASMAQTASQGRAREALARSLEVKVKSMLKDYQANVATSDPSGKQSMDEQHVVDASKQITDTTLKFTEVESTWISRASTMHSLVCLNVERFKEGVGKLDTLDPKVREAVVARAEVAWDELEVATAAH